LASNLFAFDIDEGWSRLYLERNPLVKQMKVQRQIARHARGGDPRARPAGAGSGSVENLVVDRDGFVFRLNRDLHSLPVIIGDKDTELAARKGLSRGCRRSAIDVLVACDNPLWGYKLGRHRCQSRATICGCIMLTTDGIKETKLSWDGMGQ
jgi:hypothetical protein